jgi:hypothetical protein
METSGSGIAAILLVAGIASGAAQENDLLRRAAVIKPRPEELKWQKIPWVIDLLEGQRLARAERRPIFLRGGAGEGLRAGPLSDDEVERRPSETFLRRAAERANRSARLSVQSAIEE